MSYAKQYTHLRGGTNIALIVNMKNKTTYYIEVYSETGSFQSKWPAHTASEAMELRNHILTTRPNGTRVVVIKKVG